MSLFSESTTAQMMALAEQATTHLVRVEGVTTTKDSHLQEIETPVVIADGVPALIRVLKAEERQQAGDPASSANVEVTFLEVPNVPGATRIRQVVFNDANHQGRERVIRLVGEDLLQDLGSVLLFEGVLQDPD